MLQLPKEDRVDNVLVLAAPGLAPTPRLVPLLVLGLGLKIQSKIKIK